MLPQRDKPAADDQAGPFDLFYRLLQSFYFALRGLCICLREERNLRIHLSASLWILWLAGVSRLENGELAALAVCCGLVICDELFNSAVEATVDLLSPDYHPIARKAKDIAAAGVLAGAAFALLTGYLVFIRTGRLWAVLHTLTLSPVRIVGFFLALVLTFVFVFYYPVLIKQPTHKKEEKHFD